MSERYYDAQYTHIATQVNAAVRQETWGQDIGQNSWLTVDEFRRFIEWLELRSDSMVLEVGSGLGGPALFLVEMTGCRLIGVDVNEHGVANANRLAQERGLDRARFQQGDASQPLAFPDETFDAVLCIDTINHLRDRPRILAEWTRVLKSGGRLLFTDPITVSGILTSEEISLISRARRSRSTPVSVLRTAS
jgi:ubiquinone/menaquinone biosynthesis C-methylase UbiE